MDCLKKHQEIPLLDIKNLNDLLEAFDNKVICLKLAKDLYPDIASSELIKCADDIHKWLFIC